MNEESRKTMSALKALIRPLIPRSVLRARTERIFFSERSWYAKHLGAFPSFAAANAHIALRAIPAQGYVLDHKSWLEERMHLSAHDYPPLFWLNRFLLDERLAAIGDFGGSVGVSFYAFKKYIAFPREMLWTVCELPDAVKAGTEIAHEKAENQIEFTREALKK